MRISDWSSEVCSSDLIAHNFPFVFPPNAQTRQPRAIQEYIVANIKSSKKRAKQAVVRNLRNNSQRSMLRTSVQKVLKALAAHDAAVTLEAFKSAPQHLATLTAHALTPTNKSPRHHHSIHPPFTAIPTDCPLHTRAAPSVLHPA